MLNAPFEHYKDEGRVNQAYPDMILVQPTMGINTKNTSNYVSFIENKNNLTN